MQNISTVTERSFAKACSNTTGYTHVQNKGKRFVYLNFASLFKAWGISSTLILPRSSMWKSVKKSKHLRSLKYVTRFTKIEYTKQY